VLYLGIGAGRLAVPLLLAGIDLVGVDAHPGMLAHLQRRAPQINARQALIEDVELGREFDLVIGPSSILSSDANLAAAARHVWPGGRVGMELMNPHWLSRTPHAGVRLRTESDGTTTMEIDYRLPDGSTAVQAVEDWRPGPAPEATAERLRPFGLELLWIGPRPEAALAVSPTYYVLAGRPDNGR